MPLLCLRPAAERIANLDHFAEQGNLVTPGAMAVSLKRLWQIGGSDTLNRLKPTNLFTQLGAAAALHSEDGSAKYDGEFSKWNNGGGVFHSLACIDPTAVIEVGAIVHSKAMVGANVHIGSGAVIGPAVSIGGSTKIGYNAVLSNCSIGDSCAVYNGVCIGQDGFGFFVDDQGNMVKKPQLLNVRIGKNVEIGANSCVDRGSWRDTVIGDHSKIDNLVQIAHNVVIGRSCIICGQVGIAGSATIGDYVTLGGRVAVRDHVSVASKVRLAANSCVTKDISEPGDFAGFPAVPAREWRRQVANQRWISKQGGS